MRIDNLIFLSVVGGGRLACSNFLYEDLVWKDTKLENKFGPWVRSARDGFLHNFLNISDMHNKP